MCLSQCLMTGESGLMVSGCHVIATARRTEIISQLGEDGMSVVSLDVTDPQSIANAKDEVSAITGGRLDILVNNA